MGIRTFLKGVKNWSSGGWNGVQPNIWDPEHPLNRWGTASQAYGSKETIENDFEAYVQEAYKRSGPVFACITARQYVFSEAVFKYRNKTTGELFGDKSLALLEKPWPGGTTGELLGRMEQDASLAGNSWWTRCDDAGRLGNAAKGQPGERLVHLRPDWVTMVVGSVSGDVRAADAKFLGITYRPQGEAVGVDGVLLHADEIAHYSPIPDPVARFRGVSWITSVIPQVQSHKSAARHKGGFFDNAAVPNIVVSMDKDISPDDFNTFVELMNESHTGSWNAYKTLYLGGGADVKPLSHDFKSMDFASIIGKDESLIAAAAGVPASWVGFSEGMQGSALNTGNMAANRRRFADGTIRPLWKIAVASLAVLLDIPQGAELWWDESGIAFLREDQRDRAEIMRIDMNAVDAGLKAGFEPDACVEAVASNDITKLVGKHTGLVSVQMQPPVDPDNKIEETEGQARIMQTMGQALQAFTSAGFTHESAVEAVASNDITKLVKDPDFDTWSPTGQPLMTAQGGAGPGAPPGGGKPAAGDTGPPTGGPGTKPPAKPPGNSPGGGSNG